MPIFKGRRFFIFAFSCYDSELRNLDEGQCLSYSEADGYLKSLSNLGSRPGLENIRRLCALLGNPQDSIKFVHIAGTNGKGSVSTMIASILKYAGIKTGLFLSPHLEDYTDGLYKDGRRIEKNEFARLVSVVRKKAQMMAEEGVIATEFEVLTACAFLWFAENCDIAVVETGMGGTLDATNVIKNTIVSVITAVDIDHTAFLGNTIEEIAAHKSGIIKPKGVTVCYPVQNEEALNVIKKAAHSKGNRFVLPDITNLKIIRSDLSGTEIEYCGRLIHISLVGRHQALNAVTAIEAVRALITNGYELSEEEITRGIDNAYIPARQEVICRRPLIMLDGSHNLQGIEALGLTIKENIKGKRIAVIMGMLKDKEYEKAIKIMCSFGSAFFAVTPRSPRALDKNIMAETAQRYCSNVTAYDDYRLALNDAAAFCGEEGAIIICGSLYMADMMRKAAAELFI